MRWGAERHHQETARSREQRGSRGPALWLIGEARREHRQRRPAQRQSAQERTGDPGLRRRDERGSDEQRGSDGPCGRGGGHDLTDVSSRPGRGPRRVLPRAVPGQPTTLGGVVSELVRHVRTVLPPRPVLDPPHVLHPARAGHPCGSRPARGGRRSPDRSTTRVAPARGRPANPGTVVVQVSESTDRGMTGRWHQQCCLSSTGS